MLSLIDFCTLTRAEKISLYFSSEICFKLLLLNQLLVSDVMKTESKYLMLVAVGFICILATLGYVNATFNDLMVNELQQSKNSSFHCFDGVALNFKSLQSTDNLKAFMNLFIEDTFMHGISDERPKINVEIVYDEEILMKSIDTDESYNVKLIEKIYEDVIYIKAANNFGVIYALQDVSQMVSFDFDKNCYTLNEDRSRLLLKTFKPRFRHREILIDTSRHYLSLRTIFSILKTMAKAKFNVMHWHLSDSQSFPICLNKFKDICRHSSFSDQERYTEEDVKRIVSFANILGIRVVPELDLPGHSSAILKAFPDLKACPDVFNIAIDKTYDVLTEILAELAKLFPDVYFHTGGDEVKTTCWSQNFSIMKWMNRNNYDENDAYAFFMSSVHNTLINLGKVPIVWDEAFRTFGKSKFDMSKTVVVQLWHHISLPSIVEQGFSLIWSESKVDGWYLDHLTDKWSKMYQQDVCSGLSPSQCSKFILGGGGLMWGEKVDTSNILNTIWPRAAVIAKNLWDGTDDDIPTVHALLFRFRCILLKSGYGCGTVDGVRARMGPYKPGTCAI